MNNRQETDSLARLVQLRQRELERRQAELANRQALRERYQRNVDQLENLWRNSSAGASAGPELALNCANYKQTVLQLASTHRADLQRHELSLDHARLAVLQASREHGAVEQVFERRRQARLREDNLREQKSQDAMATQLWQRKST